MPDSAAPTQTTPSRPYTMALVMNAQAGALLGRTDGAGTLEDRLRAEAGTLHIVPEDAGTLPERVAQAQATGPDCVVVAGGDGTAACVAQALAGTGIALGLIPCGTMNLLARDLGLDPADHDACVRLLAEGVPRAIDVGEVTGEDGERHIFLCASMIGTPARLSRHREAGRQRGNGVLAWAGFGVAALRALTKNRSMRLVLQYDGQVRRVRTPSLTITVNQLDDAAGRLFGRSCLDGGQLALYLVPRRSALAQLGLLLRTVWRGSLDQPEIEMILTDAVEIGSPHAAIHVLVDGEMRVLRPRLRYSLRPRALKILGKSAAA